MTSEQLRAHKKLLKILPVKTVEKVQINKKLNGGSKPKPLSVWGERYPSVAEAAKAVGVTENTIRRWANSGEAARWEDDPNN